jgi:hypothetical protein
MRVSESGAPIQTGRGVSEVVRRIEEAFAACRQVSAGPQIAKLHQQSNCVEPTPQAPAYTEQHEARFHQRAKHIALQAVAFSHISATRNNGVWEIEEPTQTAEELIREALWQSRK